MESLLKVAADQVQRIPAMVKAPVDVAALAGGVVSILGVMTSVLGVLVALCSLAWAGLRLHMMYVEWREWRQKKKGG